MKNPRCMLRFFIASLMVLVGMASSSAPLRAQDVGGVDGSIGITKSYETSVNYAVRPWVGWLKGDHFTVGAYGSMSRYSSGSIIYDDYGLGAFGSYELWPDKKVTPFARLGVGVNYSHRHYKERNVHLLYPQALPELGVRWHVSDKLSIQMSYQYELNLGNQGIDGRPGGFLLGVRFRF